MSQVQKKESENKSTGLQHFFSFPENNFEKGLKSLSFFCLLFSFIILLDYFLPRTSKQDVVVDQYFLLDDVRLKQRELVLTEELKNYNLIIKIITTNDKISLDPFNSDYSKIKIGDALLFEHTLIFGTTTGVSNTNKDWKYTPYYSMYGTLLFIPILLITLSLVALFKSLKTDWRYTVAVLQMMLLGGFVFMRLFY